MSKFGPYKELNKERNDIRLLLLLPGFPGTPIRCRLCTASLSRHSPPRYEALSYAWGKTTQGKTIKLLNGWHVHTLQVTDNLFRALDGLRYRFGKSRRLWVDALCINQADLEERASQVSMMDLIFSTAERVDIWLGSPTSSVWTRVGQAVREIRRWPSAFRCDLRIGHHKVSLESSRARYAQRLSIGCWLIARTPQAIEEALESSEPMWSSRLWVVQECVLARKISLCCGRLQTPYRKDPPLDDILSQWYSYCGRPGTKLGDKSCTPLFDDLAKLLRQYRVFQPKSFFAAAQITQETSSADLRDRVYAVLGILPKSATGGNKGNELVPDYTLETWKVYAIATFAALISTHSDAPRCLNLLAVASCGSGTDMSLPGWAFDFRFMGAYRFPSYPEFSWCRPSPGHLDTRALYWTGDLVPREFLIGGSHDFRHLRVSGLKFATITACYSRGSETPERMSEDGSVASQENPAHLFACPSEARLQVVVRAVRRQLCRDENPHCTQPPAGLRSFDRIIQWADGRSITEKLDIYEQSFGEGERGLEPVGHMIKLLFEAWNRSVIFRSPSDGRCLPTPHRSLGTDKEFWNFFIYAHGRPPGDTLDFFATSNGFLGLATTAVCEGDLVALIRGCRWPVLLRRTNSEWEFKGICLVHGIMEGELLQIWDELDVEEEEFVLC